MHAVKSDLDEQALVLLSEHAQSGKISGCIDLDCT